jgi:peptidoglycan/LPS O-acetylase OafA/YrhL
MNKELSAYLDFSRFSAAILVFFCHLDGWVPGLFPFFEHLGLEAVGVFFVLSGYVIGYVTSASENKLRIYAINRAARIYSVVIPCLLITLLLDMLGRHIWQNNYYEMNVISDYSYLSKNLREILKILISLTFINQSWDLNITPGSDPPFWSLCCEVPYYIMFGALFFIRDALRWIVFASLCILVGPKIVGLFPLWLSGYLCFRYENKINLSPRAAQAIFAASIGVWCISETIRWHYSIAIGLPNTHIGVDWWQFYIAGIPFAFSILGFRFANIQIYRRLAMIRWLSGATFTLYLLHYPVATFVNTALPRDLNQLARWIVLFLVVMSIVLLVAEFTERRKVGWRKCFEAILSFADRFREIPKISS